MTILYIFTTMLICTPEAYCIDVPTGQVSQQEFTDEPACAQAWASIQGVMPKGMSGQAICVHKGSV